MRFDDFQSEVMVSKWVNWLMFVQAGNLLCLRRCSFKMCKLLKWIFTLQKQTLGCN